MLQRFKNKNNRDQSWSIDAVSGHCAYGNNIHVCFDPSLTFSGAIRAVGPFGPPIENLEKMSSLMIDITIAIEEQLGGYVVWGEIQDQEEYVELCASILGERCGFIPNISLRSSLLLTKPCETEIFTREWDLSAGHARHRSNAIAERPPEGPADLALLHPHYYRGNLDILEQACGSLASFGPFYPNPKLAGWTPALSV